MGLSRFGLLSGLGIISRLGCIGSGNSLEVLNQVGDIIISSGGVVLLVLLSDLLEVSQVVRAKLVDDAWEQVLQFCT